MTIFRKSCKVIMSKEDILKVKPRRGIDIVFTPIKFNSNIYVATISGTDLNPSNPLEELESATELDNFINDQLSIYSDRIREPKDLQKIPQIARQVAMNINDPKLNSNKYDFMRSKSKVATPSNPDESFRTIQEA
jgi:hypothetical protein